MPVRAFILHWDPATLAAKSEAVRGAGAEVVGQEAEAGQRAYDEVRRLAPDVLIVWLQFKPSHGRMTAAAVRGAPWGRSLPVLFVTDDLDPIPAATLRRVREAVPDALFDRPDRLAFWMARLAARAAPPRPSGPAV